MSRQTSVVGDGRLGRVLLRGKMVTSQRGGVLYRRQLLDNVRSSAILDDAPVLAKTNNNRVNQEYKSFLDHWDVGLAFDHQQVPHGCWMQLVSGKLPEDLLGTYFKNGPGRFSRGQEAYEHPFDGDGLVASIAFKDGTAFFRSRFVETPELAAEAAAGKVLFRGTFATQRAGGWTANAMDLYIKNTSNTNVVPWRGSLLTLFEAALPYRLDPYTLRTVELETLGSKLAPGLPFKLDSDVAVEVIGALQRLMGSNHLLPPKLVQPGGYAFTAHPHIDSVTGRMCLYTYQMQPAGIALSTLLKFWELDPVDGGVHCSCEYEMQGGFLLHDFALTTNYYVMFQCPVKMDITPYVMGMSCAASCVRWAPDTPSSIHIIPRPGSAAAQRGERARIIKADPAFIFHHANAFEEKREGGGAVLVVDSIHYASLPAVGKQALEEQQVDPDVAFTSQLKRTHIALDRGTVEVSEAYPGVMEYPRINDKYQAQAHRYIYGTTVNLATASMTTSKCDTHTRTATTWQAPARYFATEPQFIPRPGNSAEDDGWLVTVAFDSSTQKSEVVVLDAREVEKGPIAVLAVPSPLPHGLHGNWTGTYYGPGTEGPGTQPASGP